MTVSELIAQLSKIDGTTEVYLEGEWDDILNRSYYKKPLSLQETSVPYYVTKSGEKVPFLNISSLRCDGEMKILILE